MKKLMIFALLVAAAVMMCGFMPSGEDMEIYDDVVRLHVLANSDSKEDQAIKLAVRDAVLENISGVTAGATDAESAAALISDNIGAVRDVAVRTLSSLGSDAPVSVTLSEEYYPTRNYGDVSLPAGKYTSLRVMIGSAEGQNWWCVLYPAICVSSAKANAVFKQTGFSTEQINILTDNEKPVYKIKFKLLELMSG